MHVMHVQAKKKKCARQTRKRDEGQVFSTPFFFDLSFPKSKSSSKSARALNRCTLKHIVSSLLSALLRFSFSSEYSFVAILVGRARAYIYLETRDLDEFLERRDEKKREKERKRERDDDPRGKREDEEERSNRFFGAFVCVRASEDERKRERKRDFPLLFKRFIKGALRAEFSLSLSLSLSLSFVRVCDSSSEYTFLRNTQTRTKTKAKCVLLFLPRRRRSHREEEE
jgi:hypothetical protein